jgi:hypothetical protein
MGVILEVSIERLTVSHNTCDVEMVSSHGQANSMDKVTITAFIPSLRFQSNSRSSNKTIVCADALDQTTQK